MALLYSFEPLTDQHRFIVQKAHEHGPELTVILSQLYQEGAIGKTTLQPSERWQKALCEPFERVIDTAQAGVELDRVACYCNALLDSTLVLELNEEQTNILWADLDKLLRRAVQINDAKSLRSVDLFALGAGFHFLVEHSSDSKSIKDLWPSLCQASSICGHSISFWRAILAFAKREKIGLEGSHIKRAIIRCLGSPSHELR